MGQREQEIRERLKYGINELDNPLWNINVNDVKHLLNRVEELDNKYNNSLKRWEEIEQIYLSDEKKYKRRIEELKKELRDSQENAHYFNRLYNKYYRDYVDAKNRVEELEKENKEWKYFYDKAIERKKRLEDAIKNGEEIRFAVLDKG